MTNCFGLVFFQIICCLFITLTVRPKIIQHWSFFLFTGTMFGNVGTFASSGYLCEYGFDNGWGSIFYITGEECVHVLCCVAKPLL